MGFSEIFGSDILAAAFQKVSAMFLEIYNLTGASTGLPDFALDTTSDGTQLVIGDGRVFSNRQSLNGGGAPAPVLLGATYPIAASTYTVYHTFPTDTTPATLFVDSGPLFWVDPSIGRMLYQVTSDGVNLTSVLDLRNMYLQPIGQRISVSGVATSGQTTISVAGPIIPGSEELVVEGARYQPTVHYTTNVATNDVEGGPWGIDLLLLEGLELGENWTVVYWI